jgi:uncharacterized membrane protein
MVTPTLWFMLLQIAVALLLVGLSIPLILRRVKPNYLYGFRTPKTLSSERIWYEANAYAGRLTLWLGIILTIAAISLYVALRANFIAYATTYTLVLLCGLVATLVLSFRHLRSL